MHTHLQLPEVKACLYAVVLQGEATAAAETHQQSERRRQEALDSVAAVKSDLWELWQKVSTPLHHTPSSIQALGQCPLC